MRFTKKDKKKPMSLPALISVKSWDAMPIEYCPGVLHMYSCRVASTGQEFKTGHIISEKGHQAYLFEYGNRMSRLTAKKMRKDRIKRRFKPWKT